MTQRWNDLLFAHWPMRIAEIEEKLPQGAGGRCLPGFRMDRRGSLLDGQDSNARVPPIPGARKFPELNLRTLRAGFANRYSGGVFLFADAGSLLAVIAARTLYHLPYYWAQMSIKPRATGSSRTTSRRLLSGKPVRFAARYRGLGPTRKLAQSRPGTIEYFLTERYCLFTRDPLGRLLRRTFIISRGRSKKRKRRSARTIWRITWD